jgi:hypothetical protein
VDKARGEVHFLPATRYSELSSGSCGRENGDVGGKEVWGQNSVEWRWNRGLGMDWVGTEVD